MKLIIVVFCLIGAVSAKPTESVSQSAENNTLEDESSEETTSNPHSESESLETIDNRTSEESHSQSDEDDTTSEESNSQSDEVEEVNSRDETTDDTMSSEENVRKRWFRVFQSLFKILSFGINSSSGVKGRSGHLNYELEKSSDSSSNSANTSESSDSRSVEELKHCGNDTQSCESESEEDYLFQSVGDDDQYSLEVLHKNERHLTLK